MDRITRILGEYASEVDYGDVPSEVVHEVKRRVIDSLAVAFAAYGAEPVVIARRTASKHAAAWGGRIIGTRYRVPPDWASFVDGVMIRYHDYNDTYLSREPLHPGDMIAAALSLGDALCSSGKDAIAAIAVGYEASVSLCDGGSLRKKGWDHVNFLGVGSTLVSGKLLGLDADRIQHALAIYAVPHGSMRQTRVGELSMWKGAAAANSTRNAVFASLLAAEGFTGPFKPFEGEMGFIKQLLQGDFDMSVLSPLAEGRAPRRILDTYIKPYPVEYHAQTAVEAALKLREEVKPEEVEKVTIDTFQAAYDIIGPKDPEKWDPHTKETADHSLMWITAATLVWGPIRIEHYGDVRNPTVLSLMKRMEVRVEPELDRMYPAAFPNRITVVTKNGRKFTEQVDYAKGHPKNPMSDGELERRFHELTASVMPEAQRKRLLQKLWRLEDYSVADIVEDAVI
ncbi:MAG: propanediol utilization protein [Candidatus Terraquivivens tikiterensis]|uniref:Propanediol utilization protein n=1 Tax=Candidatus Terraquivivens tikiterensis TaxID=1980982 RepID=A0A2R7YA83_9ARCH|nr:MAG: propanediol utilization protein [Candidatus Terraquivivens tikiterensis]